MNIEKLLSRNNLISDVISIEFGKDYDNEVVVICNGEVLFSLQTKLDCYKYDLGYDILDDEIDAVIELLKLLKRMIKLVLIYNEG